jgi:hypothetical protein
VSGETAISVRHTHKAGMRASGDDERHAVLRDLCVAVLAVLVVGRRQERRHHGEARKCCPVRIAPPPHRAPSFLLASIIPLLTPQQ